MMNYIPIDTLDSNESLRNFILYYQLPNSILSFKFMNNRVQQGEDTSKVRSILNASVDGVVLCFGDESIDLINPAAQRMFGHKQSDVAGLPLVTLLDVKHHEQIRKIVEELKHAATKSESNRGELLEVECVRKNQTTFPASVNLFVVKFEGEVSVICFIKDVTSEKKHNALLAEEKVKSENLLRNILPEAVATRLKQGKCSMTPY